MRKTEKREERACETVERKKHTHRIAKRFYVSIPIWSVVYTNSAKDVQCMCKHDAGARCCPSQANVSIMHCFSPVLSVWCTFRSIPKQCTHSPHTYLIHKHTRDIFSFEMPQFLWFLPFFFAFLSLSLSFLVLLFRFYMVVNRARWKKTSISFFSIHSFAHHNISFFFFICFILKMNSNIYRNSYARWNRDRIRCAWHTVKTSDRIIVASRPHSLTHTSRTK